MTLHSLGTRSQHQVLPFRSLCIWNSVKSTQFDCELGLFYASVHQRLRRSKCERGGNHGSQLEELQSLPRSMSIHHLDADHTHNSLGGHGTLENLPPTQPTSVFFKGKA